MTGLDELDRTGARHLWLAVNVLDRRCRRIIRQAEKGGAR